MKRVVMRVVKAALALPVVVGPTAAIAGKYLNAGPYPRTRYEDSVSHVWQAASASGQVVITADDIRTINCHGCDTVEYYPGTVMNARNTGKTPICFAYDFTPDEQKYGALDVWGAKQIFLLKPGQSVYKFAGLVISFGETRQVNLGWKGEIQTWSPVSKKDCGTNPYDY